MIIVFFIYFLEGEAGAAEARCPDTALEVPPKIRYNTIDETAG
jgi:hypothetical protein